MSGGEALTISEMPQVKNKIIKQKASYSKILKSKYINYTEDELTKMNNEKKNLIMELESKNSKLKEELAKTIEKLNVLMKNHSDILIKDENDFLKKIEELEEIYFLRKHDHTLSAKYNSTFKQKYNALKEKAKRLKDEEKISQKILKDKSLYENLKNENFELNRKIQEMKFKNIQKTKEYENLNMYQKMDGNNFQIISNILSDSSLSRYENLEKIESKKKTIEKLKDQFNDLNEYIKKNKAKISEINKNKSESIIEKINTELEYIKKDLSPEVNDIIQNCYNNKILLLNDTSSTLIKSSSHRKIETKIKPLLKSNSSILEINTNSNKLENRCSKKLSIFSKIKILKSNKPYKLGGSSQSNQMNRNVSMFVTKEVIDFNKKSPQDEELDKDIQNINEDDYQQLVELKVNYVDTNERLLNDIKEKKKNCTNKIKHLNYCIEKNMDKLSKIKEVIDFVKKEIEALELKVSNKIRKVKITSENEKNMANKNNEKIK